MRAPRTLARCADPDAAITAGTGQKRSRQSEGFNKSARTNSGSGATISSCAAISSISREPAAAVRRSTPWIALPAAAIAAAGAAGAQEVKQEQRRDRVAGAARRDRQQRRCAAGRAVLRRPRPCRARRPASPRVRRLVTSTARGPLGAIRARSAADRATRPRPGRRRRCRSGAPARTGWASGCRPPAPRARRSARGCRAGRRRRPASPITGSQQ